MARDCRGSGLMQLPLVLLLACSMFNASTGQQLPATSAAAAALSSTDTAALGVSSPPVDAPLSLTLLSDTRPQRTPGVIQVPAKHLTSRLPMLATRPQQLHAMTFRELQRTYTGATAPSTSRSPLPGSINSQAFGLSGAAFSDSRFNAEYYTVVAKRRVGLLISRLSGVWYACSASIINRALLLTAAHCVCKWGKGQNCFPDVEGGVLQVGFDLGHEGTEYDFDWVAAGVMVPPSYAFGTDTTAAGDEGVIVNNDMALVWVYPVNDTQIGDAAGGWFAYGTNGYSFSAPLPSYGFPSAPATAMLNGLGYPYALDGFEYMQISNAATYSVKFPQPGSGQKPATWTVKNILRGTANTGGSSGGPWVANYGMDANLLGSATYGLDAERNVVMGVTSWGLKDPNALMQGASFFGVNKEYPGSYGTRGSGNIAKLMYDACENPGMPAWNLKAKGLCE